MRPDPLPAPGPDGDQPDVPRPLPADGPAMPASGAPRDDDRDGDQGAGPQQGLFVCLSAEDLDVARFAQHGQSDAMPPGPMLASVVHALTGDDGQGLAALSDDQLMGVIAATRRLESRIAWTQLAALREYAARRPAGRSGFAADELGYELHLTAQSAAEQMAFATAVADRLPRTFAALAAGDLHPVHVRIIEDETSILSPLNAAEADGALADKAGSLTFGQLRSYAHRLVLKLDPDAARKRKEAAKRDAHVRRFREDSGNAGMVARELPPDEVLASWQHVEQRALDLRAAGLPGTLQELRVQAYLDLLQERDSRAAHAAPDAAQAAAPAARGESPDPQDGTTSPAGPAGPGGPGGPGGPDDPGGPGGPGGRGSGPGVGPVGPGGPGTGRRVTPDLRPSVAALINITVPWSTVTGQSEEPGEAVGFGLLDAGSARDLVAAAARHPRTRWCVTVVAPDGTAAAHGCAAGRPGWRPGRARRRGPAGAQAHRAPGDPRPV